jgi:hypothetical protein
MDMIAWHRDDEIAIRVSYLTGKVVIALKINTRIEYFNVMAGMPKFGKLVGGRHEQHGRLVAFLMSACRW